MGIYIHEHKIGFCMGDGMTNTGIPGAETSGSIQLKPIGIVRNQVNETVWGPEFKALSWQNRVQRMGDQKRSVSEIVINPDLEEMLDGVEEFSHIMVLFWSHLVPEEKCRQAKVHPQGNMDFPEVGVFATHSPARPNRILVTEVQLLERSGNILKVTGLDAVDGSPVLDIKSYMPVQISGEIRMPDWYRKMQQVSA